jgi:gliding motility-associated-like protein
MRSLQLFRLLVSLVILLGGTSVIAQQNIQLFQEDFNAGNSSFTLNSGGPASGSGPNKWVVNDQYSGNVVYPNTTPQNQTVSGTIAQAPNSPYLHIHNEQDVATASNTNYNSGTMSDQFTYMTNGFCTVGLIDIKYTFFYLAEGNSTDFGRVYYSIDGGASWVQCGQLQYNNQTLWKYEVINLPVFENQPDLRFGFRWTNSNSGANAMSFAVDDIIAVGTYDTNNPVEITITNVSPNPVCQGANLILFYELSYPLCDGTYEVQISNASGNFSPGSSLGVFNIGTGQTSGAISVTVPNQIGNCFKIRINRVAPPPAITGEASFCIEIIDCPNTITTLQPAVTLGPDTVCNQSVIDVPFFSTGAFNSNNAYIAQLSDVNGNFTNPYILGTINDPNAYDPLLGSPPGSVSGLIPGVPPGCNYYIRVISTSPSVIPPPANYFGPFCIRECDVTTNNMVDIKVCITPTQGVDTTISLEINSWNNSASYGPGNQFQVQVLNSQFYTVINTGGLGFVTAGTNTTLTLNIPGLNDLIALLGPPGVGMYYLRIISTNSSNPNDTLGTLIRLIIGAPNPDPPGVIQSDTALCAGTILSLTINPYNPLSKYQWYSPILNNNLPFYWDFNPLLVQFNPNTPAGSYWFIVRENSYDCFSPWSDTVFVSVLTVPVVNISSPNPACVGDTILFSVPFQDATYYEWNINGGTIINASNNEFYVVFDTSAIFQVSVFALNQCGQANNTKNINIKPRPEVVAAPDETICEGSTVALTSNGTGGSNFEWFANGSSIGTGSALTITADSTQEYVVALTSAQGCKDFDTTLVSIYPNPDVQLQTTNISCFGQTDGSVTASPAAGTAPYQYTWNVPGATGTSLQNLTAGTYAVTITDANGCSSFSSTNIIEPAGMSLSFATTPVTYGQTDGTATANVIGGTLPYSFIWNTTPSQISNPAVDLAPGSYSVTITDSAGCFIIGNVDISYGENGIYIPNAFSPNADGRNDVFDFYAVNLKAASVRIYNRWGQLVFESYSSSVKWDGSFNGIPVDVGVYIYVIEATYLDGTTTLEKGNVSVLR